MPGATFGERASSAFCSASSSLSSWTASGGGSPFKRPWSYFSVASQSIMLLGSSSQSPSPMERIAGRASGDAASHVSTIGFGLPCVVQARGDAVHGGADGVVQRWIGDARPFAAEQVDLNQAERINVRVAKAHGAGKN